MDVQFILGIRGARRSAKLSLQRCSWQEAGIPNASFLATAELVYYGSQRKLPGLALAALAVLRWRRRMRGLML